MIQEFLDGLEPPTRLKPHQLVELSGKSEIFCREIRWALYNPLPPSMANIISPKAYYAYRANTRRSFGDYFEFPDEFETFRDLMDFFECSQQQLARAFCLQRSLMDRWDKSRGADTEVFRALVQTKLTANVPNLVPLARGALTVVLPQPPDQGKCRPGQLDALALRLGITPPDLGRRSITALPHPPRP